MAVIVVSGVNNNNNNMCLFFVVAFEGVDLVWVCVYRCSCGSFFVCVQLQEVLEGKT